MGSSGKPARSASLSTIFILLMWVYNSGTVKVFDKGGLQVRHFAEYLIPR